MNALSWYTQTYDIENNTAKVDCTAIRKYEGDPGSFDMMPDETFNIQMGYRVYDN